MSKATYLVGVDGSEHSERAVKSAVALAKQTGAQLVLMHVIPWSGFTPMTPEHAFSRPIEKAEEEATAKEIVLAPLEKIAKAMGVEVICEYTWGDPRKILHEKGKGNSR